MAIMASYVIVAMLIWLLMLVLTITVLVLVIRALLRMNHEPSLSTRTGSAGSNPPISADGPLFAARHRVLMALLAGAVVLVAGLVINDALPQSMYLIAALTPGLAASAVMAVIALPFPDAPVRRTTAGVRVASLESREPWTYARRYVLMQPLLAAALLIAYLGFTMATASPDDSGLMRNISLTNRNGELVSSSGPYPGAYYAVPLIVVTLVLVALTCLALWRIAHAPSSPDPRYAEEDKAWRVLLTRFAVFLSSGAMLAYAVGVLVVAGAATVRVGTNYGSLPPAYADDVYPTLGNAQIIMGGVVAVVACIYLVLACISAVRLWTSPNRGVRR
ncbi:hypothetical protein [Bifidobacterium miconisargentati]|uniref:hypothetical protein n=1 Tax=Bifidobacterium miconisargentati TaxID=2834437 RepID=UPI001BDCA002|nr:hypothetical protein [Bifidobacterium miconisargentati]MBW3090990.1 hypothetical protein [Bifidobacterium miconisargentati]